MKERRADLVDLIFRGLFSAIFLTLGLEHLFNDATIHLIMPAWLPWKRTISVLCGMWLTTGGLMILAGWYVRWAAIGLGIFVAVVTAVVHAPFLLHSPQGIVPPEQEWLFTVFQRSNFMKNVCLLGVCVLLTTYRVGRYGIQGRRYASGRDHRRP